jgi:hypothetical protein
MPRRRKDIDDGLDSSSESDKESFEISDTLLLEERELFESKFILFLFYLFVFSNVICT